MADSWNEFRKDQQKKRMQEQGRARRDEGRDQVRKKQGRRTEPSPKTSGQKRSETKARQGNRQSPSQGSARRADSQSKRSTGTRNGKEASPNRSQKQLSQRRVQREQQRKNQRRVQSGAKKRQPRARQLSPQQLARLRKRKGKLLLRFVLLALMVFVVCLTVYAYLFQRNYKDYRIVKGSEAEDVVSTRYEEMDGNILRYSQDGVAMVDKKLGNLWSSPFSMTNPVARVNQDRAVIADKDGKLLVMLDTKGVTGTAQTSYSIIKAAVAENGRVAAILDGGGDTWINFYDADGSLIAENQTTLEDPGYPLDVALSDNGVVMMVAYQFVNGSHTTSYVAFYNFGSAGQSVSDRIVSGYQYEGNIVPEIEWLGSGRGVAFRDDGFVIYGGNQIPTEIIKVKVDREIVSTFHDDENIGLVFKNDDKTRQYTMQVYNIYGDLQFEKDFSLAYTNIKMSRGYILMYNSSQLCVMTGSGKQRFLGPIKGIISSVSKLGINDYLLVMDNGVNIVRLK